MRNLGLKLIPAIILLFTWEILSLSDKSIMFLFSSPSAIVQLLWQEIQTKQMWYNIGLTSQEAVLGLILGTFFGTLTGFIIWINETVRKMLQPYLLILGALPIFALAPMLIIWLGIGLQSKVFMAAFGVFLLALAQSYEGAKFADKRYTAFTQSLGISRWKVMYKILLPGSLQWVLAGIKMNIGQSLLGAFIGEFVSSTAGLGFYILKASSLFNTTGVFVGLILLTLLSLVLNIILVLSKKYFCPWLFINKK